MPISIGCGWAGSGDADAPRRAGSGWRPGRVVAQRGVEHVDEHRLVARRHQRDVRQAAQVGDVERAVVGRAVVADEPGAVHAEHDRQALQADVVDDLVVGALQEGRVDRRDRARALEREAGGEQHRLLLGDADVEVALGQRLLEDRQAGAGVHRRGDADDALVALALAHERLAEHLRVLRRRGLAPCGLGAAGAGMRLAIEFGLAACHFSMPSRPPSSAGAKPLPLTVATWTTTGRSASKALAQRARAARARRGRR